MTNNTVFKVLLVVTLHALGSIASMVPKTKISQFPFVFSHDSATGYLGEGGLLRYAKNQKGSYAEQLECGARAFDVRPQFNQESLFFHHGNVEVNKDFSEAMGEIVEWVKLPKHANELGVKTKQKKQLGKLGLDVEKFIVSCDDLNLTYKEALETHKQGNGGGLIAVFGSNSANENSCVESNYDSSVQCIVGEKDCAENTYPTDLDVPGQQLYDHVKEVTDKPLTESTLVSANGHFQYSKDQILQGTQKGHSIITDEESFGTNKRLSEWIKSKSFQNFNLLQMDNVCNHGSDVRKSLLEHAGVTIPTPEDVVRSENNSAIGKYVDHAIMVIVLLTYVLYWRSS